MTASTVWEQRNRDLVSVNGDGYEWHGAFRNYILETSEWMHGWGRKNQIEVWIFKPG